MGLGKKVKWIWNLPDGEIQKSTDQRFCIVRGSQHFSLLDRGISIYRSANELRIKERAQIVVNEES